MSEGGLNILNLIISNRDDIIYVLALLFSIGIGWHYRKIKDIGSKETFGNILGILIIVLVSGFHAAHIFLSFAISAGIILLHKYVQISHIITSVFMFLYLLFFRSVHYFGLPSPPGHTNLIQMILTLKLIGLAFQAKDASRKLKKATKEELENIPYYEKELAEINITRIFGYSFNYVGVLTGPYMTYRTYRDPFVVNYSSKKNGDRYCNEATMEKFKSIPIFLALYLFVSYLWPIGGIFKDEFYTEKSILYRLWYVWPVFFIFRMRMYIGLTLSECVCAAAGVGMYPKQWTPTPGKGPTTEVNKKPTDDDEYDFETIRNNDVYTTETCWSFRQAMKSWNMCVQYWLVMVVYKRFPIRKIRTAATLLVSAYWHGVNPGYYFCIFAAPFYVAIEDICLKRVSKFFPEKNPLWVNVATWFFKFFAFSYMGIAFQLMTFPKIWNFYNSVFHFGYILWALQLVLALGWPMISKSLNGKSRKEKINIPTADSRKKET
ncbi:lysophospholipid acyltransferase 7 [Sergentomyia squamirostris]